MLYTCSLVYSIQERERERERGGGGREGGGRDHSSAYSLGMRIGKWVQVDFILAIAYCTDHENENGGRMHVYTHVQ